MTCYVYDQHMLGVNRVQVTAVKASLNFCSKLCCLMLRKKIFSQGLFHLITLLLLGPQFNYITARAIPHKDWRLGQNGVNKMYPSYKTKCQDLHGSE